MDLKTKVIKISISVGFIIAIGLIGYLAYFIVKDTLKPPPENLITKNLFIEKDSIDIVDLRKTETLSSCRDLYYNIWNSIYEERLNGFLGENQQENERQRQFLWKRLNFAYIEQFIALADRYFSQPNWDDNSFVTKCIKEIRNEGFVESNTPIWNSLMGFENSITWYNSTQNCIREITSAIHREDYFRSNNLSAITQRKNNLTVQNCIKSSFKLSELNTACENLQYKSYKYLSTKIKQYDNDFDTSEKYYYKDTAYQKYNELQNEVGQWNTVFYNIKELNEQLKKYKNKIDYYYF